MKYIISALAAGLLLSANAYAQTSPCDGLTGDAEKTVKAVFDTAYPYDCCDETLAKCQAKKDKCKLVSILSDEVCRQARQGKSASEIRHSIEQRAMTMTDLTPAVKIAAYPSHIWGNPASKVVLSVYLCGRCPYCSKHVPALLDALDKAGLKDQVAVNLRMFPIKSHENSTAAAMLVEAAASQNKAWPVLLRLYAGFDEYTPDRALEWASELGLDREKLTSQMEDAQIREMVVSSKKEGLTNHVESTPTFFLNGRKIQSAFDVDAILSMIREAL